MDNSINDLKKTFSKRLTLPLSVFVSVVFLTVILSGFIYYTIGKSDGKQEYIYQIQKQAVTEAEQEFLQRPLSEVRVLGEKYLWLKLIEWLPYIVFAILLGWVLHGIF